MFLTITIQINNWKSKGIDLKCSINTSANELIDDNFTAWSKDIITSKNLERLDFEIEITESHSL